MNRRLALVLTTCLLISFHAQASPLEIHIINVQQGACALVRGPNGTTVLIDGGNVGRGYSRVVPYLKKLGIAPGGRPLDYMIVSHRHADHFRGLIEVIKSGYDTLKVYEDGSPQTFPHYDTFVALVRAKTQARRVGRMPLGKMIDLGNGASMMCVAGLGKVYRGHRMISDPMKADENDLSVGLLITYNQFQFLTCGDMGGGQWSEDKRCTGRKTTQKNVESELAKTLVKQNIISETYGIEVLHVNHHGSESSSNFEYMNILSPAVAVISVGDGQSADWFLPRKAVVENVLMAGISCITAPKALVLQTEEGKPTGDSTSFEGVCVGDVVITTDGLDTYIVNATGNVSQGPDERRAARLPRTFKFDEKR